MSKYYVIFLLNGQVKEVSSNDEAEARDKTFDFWRDALERSSGEHKRDYYSFNELQKFDSFY